MTDSNMPLKGSKQRILNELCRGGFISGQQLGEKLGISRAAVAKHIKSLQQLGIEIFSVTGKGYCISGGLSLIDQQQVVASYLARGGHGALFESHPIVDSTNSILMRRLADKSSMASGTVIVAESQTAGRGRRGRTWQSPFGANLYYSYYWQLNDGLQAAMGLSIAVGLAIYDCIYNLYGKKVALKWPNDVLVNDKKLAGVLVELEGQPEGPCHLVIGIGLNFNMPANFEQYIDQPWTDLVKMGCKLDKNTLIAQLTRSLEIRLAQYSEFGLNQMYSEWNSVNAFRGELVNLMTGSKSWSGICEGIDQQGGIRLRCDGQCQTYYGGELSLRKVVK